MQEEVDTVKQRKNEFFTVPNMLSLFRLALIPVYVILYRKASTPADYAVASAILAVSCLTDMFDGRIARRYNMVTTVGKLLDPLADKMTQFALMICLVEEYPVIWPLIALFVVKESFQLLAGWLTYRKGKMLTCALLSGKISTTVLFVSLIVIVLFHQKMTTPIILWISVVDSVFLLIAFAHYVLTYWKKSSLIQDIA